MNNALCYLWLTKMVDKKGNKLGLFIVECHL